MIINDLIVIAHFKKIARNYIKMKELEGMYKECEKIVGDKKWVLLYNEKQKAFHIENIVNYINTDDHNNHEWELVSSGWGDKFLYKCRHITAKKHKGILKRELLIKYDMEPKNIQIKKKLRGERTV